MDEEERDGVGVSAFRIQHAPWWSLSGDTAPCNTGQQSRGACAGPPYMGLYPQRVKTGRGRLTHLSGHLWRDKSTALSGPLSGGGSPHGRGILPGVDLDMHEVNPRTSESYTLHPTSFILHPTPCTLHPSPYTLHPAPYTLLPTPYTLHPSPCTLHPTP